MMEESNQKVKASHLKRNAYLYIRQSTMRQVFENTESTKRQYALRQRAVVLGWTGEQIQVIDCDLGQSGASAADRKGFQQLVAEVSMGRAGIVLGLEVSRLARNCADWHRLLEICALSDTLILDEDGLYNTNDFNDRLLLGLKGTMSEAELHFLYSRLRGGILNKARRGELASTLPVGFVYDEQKRVRLDPDKQVCQAIELFFQTYRRTGSALATVKHFRRQGILFPSRVPPAGKGALVWKELVHPRAVAVLHNPRYAGAFFFGRHRIRKGADGRIIYQDLPRNEWHAFIPDAHEGYISWKEYEENQRRLSEYSLAYGRKQKKSPPREGSALLQGVVLCGVCGKRMTVCYHTRNNRTHPDYICQYGKITRGERVCQNIPGSEIDKAVGELILKTLTPMTLEVALEVQQELSSRLEEADRLRAKQVERAGYEVELAKRRYMQVDPDNRLVADALEAEWNRKLRTMKEAQEEYERQRKADRVFTDKEERARIMALATDLPRLWNDPNTADRERKRMVRLLLEDVTLSKEEKITAHVRFRGGTTTTLTIPIPKRSWETWQTPPEVIAEIDRLLDHYTYNQVATLLNERGFRSGKGLLFHHRMIGPICKKYGLKSHLQRLREKGMLTVKEAAKLLGISIYTVRKWGNHGLLQTYHYDESKQCLYQPPGPNAPISHMGVKLSQRRIFPKVASDRTKEVQYEV